MKIRILAVLAVLGFAVLASATDLVNIADSRTIGKWKGNEQGARDIQANFAALDAGTVKSSTAATVLTGSVTTQIVTYASGTNSAGLVEFSAYTNIAVRAVPTAVTTITETK